MENSPSRMLFTTFKIISFGRLLPDSLLLGLLQFEVPPQHRHYGPLLLLCQVAQVNHGCSSSFCQRAGVEMGHQPALSPSDKSCDKKRKKQLSHPEKFLLTVPLFYSLINAEKKWSAWKKFLSCKVNIHVVGKEHTVLGCCLVSCFCRFHNRLLITASQSSESIRSTSDSLTVDWRNKSTQTVK